MFRAVDQIDLSVNKFGKSKRKNKKMRAQNGANQQNHSQSQPGTQLSYNNTFYHNLSQSQNVVGQQTDSNQSANDAHQHTYANAHQKKVSSFQSTNPIYSANQHSSIQSQHIPLQSINSLYSTNNNQNQYASNGTYMIPSTAFSGIPSLPNLPTGQVSNSQGHGISLHGVSQHIPNMQVKPFMLSAQTEAVSCPSVSSNLESTVSITGSLESSQSQLSLKKNCKRDVIMIPSTVLASKVWCFSFCK